LDNLIIVGEDLDTARWYKLADVFCALSPIENIWSTTIQEAFCMGKPCTITKVGYTEKVLLHKEDAYLISPQNPYELSNAILELKNNEYLLNKLSNNCLSKWKNKFDSKNTIKELIKLYKTLI